MKKEKLFIALLAIGLCHFSPLLAQTADNGSGNTEIFLSKDSIRKFFGVYEFNPDFKMKIFSGSSNKVFAQRIGDSQKFQIFPKRSTLFFLKAMPAELEFQKNSGNEILILHQDGKDMKATKISSNPYELYDTIVKLDSSFYAAYNNRNLKLFMSYLSPELEFYHDLTGLTDYKRNFEIFKEKFSDTSLIMRREVARETVEVYPIKDFGAIEMGTQKYFVVDKANGDRLASEPRFIHVWKNTNGNWQIVRVISYDH